MKLRNRQYHEDGSSSWIPGGKIQKAIERARIRIKEEIDIDISNLNLIYIINHFFIFHSKRIEKTSNYSNFNFGNIIVFHPMISRVIRRYEKAIKAGNDQYIKMVESETYKFIKSNTSLLHNVKIAKRRFNRIFQRRSEVVSRGPIDSFVNDVEIS